MESLQFLDILFLAMLAGFVLFRLWAVLGRKTGHERRPDAISPRSAGENGVPLPSRTPAPVPAATGRPAVASRTIAAVPAGTPLANALNAIREADRGFDPDSFMTGARAAHEMIANAFATGDRDALKPLLDEDIYAAFDGAIRARETQGLKSEFTYVRLRNAEIVDAALRGRTAEVTVRFVVELMAGEVDANGAIVSGDPAVMRQVTDIWTFARDTRAGDPNWRVIATGSEA